MSNTFLFQMPGESEWFVLIIAGLLYTIFPVLTAVFYFQVRRLRRENKELLERLLSKN